MSTFLLELLASTLLDFTLLALLYLHQAVLLSVLISALGNLNFLVTSKKYLTPYNSPHCIKVHISGL
jgi:hypothetical protein